MPVPMIATVTSPITNRRKRTPTWKLIETFTAANGTQITSRASDNGITPVVWSGGYLASNAVIQNNRAQFGNSGIIYTCSTTLIRIVCGYVSINNGGYNDIRFYFTNTDATNGYGIRFNSNSLTIIDYTVGTLAWDAGGNPTGFTSGTVTIDLTAGGVTVTCVDGSIGTVVRNYTASMRNSTSAKVSIGGNPSSPAFDNLYAK